MFSNKKDDIIFGVNEWYIQAVFGVFCVVAIATIDIPQAKGSFNILV